MHPLERAFRWAGGGIFVASLAFCAYTYIRAFSRPAEFNPGAVAVDVLLFAVFASHHSVFAREPVKGWLARSVPDRLVPSLYVWIASLLLMSVCVLWQPVGGDAYDARGWPAGLLAVAQVAGLLVIAAAVRKIDALELAGIRRHPNEEPLQISGPYRWVRHPIYLGWLLATFGAAHMTGDRLVFAGIAAIYLLIAMPIEERSLRRSFGESYTRYAEHVRWRVVPYIY